jgi:peptidoglycan hydrolase-like protein with peptidoglycan-binding domain
MPLQCRFFRDDKALQSCLVNDAAHVQPGAKGVHVEKIQAALIFLDGAVIDPGEVSARFYGHSTSTAVLAFKQRRDIVNRAYQTRPDNIVGKMTIAAMDSELLRNESPSPNRLRMVCTRQSY